MKCHGNKQSVNFNRDDDLKDRNWPSRSEILEYRNLARQQIEKVILRLKIEDNSVIDWNHPAYILVMGIEHEKIHLETTTVLIRQLDLKYIVKDIPDGNIFNNQCKVWKKDQQSVSENKFIDVPKGQIVVGRPKSTKSIENQEHLKNY